MKKFILIFTLIAAYAISASTVSANVTVDEKSNVTVVMAGDDQSTGKIIEDDKDKKKDAKKDADKGTATVKKEAKAEKPAVTGCSEAQMKSCAASQKSCCGEKKPAEKK